MPMPKEGGLAMFNRFRESISIPSAKKPEDEVQVEENARAAIEESRKQIQRANSILSTEIKRLDSILERR